MRLRLNAGQRYTLNDQGKLIKFTKGSPEHEVSNATVERAKLLEEMVPIFSASNETAREVPRFTRVAEPPCAVVPQAVQPAKAEPVADAAAEVEEQDEDDEEEPAAKAAEPVAAKPNGQSKADRKAARKAAKAAMAKAAEPAAPAPKSDPLTP